MPRSWAAWRLCGMAMMLLFPAATEWGAHALTTNVELLPLELDGVTSPRAPALGFRFAAPALNITVQVNGRAAAVLAPGYAEHAQGSDGGRRRRAVHATAASRRCHYRGEATVHRGDGAPALGARVAFSTCAGWVEGHVVAADGSFDLELWGEASPEGLLRGRHWVAPFGERAEAGSCGTEGGHFMHPVVLDDSQRGRRAVPGVTGKVVELMVVNDKARIDSFGGDLDAVADNTVAVVNQLYLYYQNGDGVFSDVEIDVVLVEQEFWSTGDPYATSQGSCSASAEVDTNALLDDFTSWFRSFDSGGVAIDNAALFSGFNFCGSTVGLAWVGTMCDDGTSSSINMVDLGDSISGRASVVAHEVRRGRTACAAPRMALSCCSADGPQLWHATRRAISKRRL